MDAKGKANATIADKLRETADLLAQQGANPFRVSAYRKAADTLTTLPDDVTQRFRAEGLEALTALPHVGPSIAGAIRELILTGRWGQLERLRGAVDPEALFRAVPGIGAELAHRIHDVLTVDTLEGLETAAHDGRLEEVPGIGSRRAAAIRSSLASMLGRVRVPRAPLADGPEVAALLDVDREYREQAAAGGLPTIAPRRFNPAGEAWLPVLHTDRGPWHFTALFSNTARAHELGTTRDWVVLYFHRGQEEEGQCTVVTETRGTLVGKRVVRGRESACRSYYDETAVPTATAP